MSKIKLVLCRHDESNKDFLFYAPANADFKFNDRVIVETKYGEKTASVVNFVNIDDLSDEFDFIIKLAKATLPLKRVLGKLEYKEFDYASDSIE